MDFYGGEIFLIDKPPGWTTFDVVNKVRYVLKKNPVENFSQTINLKVGHAGTLDPLATGLLIICTGKFTKEIDQYQAKEKEYTGTFFLGATTPSFDLETKPEKEYETSHITEKLIFETAKKFIGKILQMPPAHSAKKINGQRAYKKARKGQVMNLQPAEILIHEFEIKKIEMPLIDFRIVCSKGTYIRSMANDFGKALGSGAYLHSLCRTRIGEFKLEDAITVKDFAEKFQLTAKT